MFKLQVMVLKAFLILCFFIFFALVAIAVLENIEMSERVLFMLSGLIGGLSSLAFVETLYFPPGFPNKDKK